MTEELTAQETEVLVKDGKITPELSATLADLAPGSAQEVFNSLKDAGLLTDAKAAYEEWHQEYSRQRLGLINLNSVNERETEWLIPGYMPRGQINVWAGDGGTGKTACWVDLAAAISTGRRPFFEQVVPDDFATNEPGKVLFFSSEDSIECVLLGRLRRAGADMNNVYSMSLRDERFTELKFGSALLKDIITELRPKLAVFDPLQGFIPADTQMSARNQMRACLSSLIGLGEETGTTILIIAHTNKRSGVYGRNRVSDSSDIWDCARAVTIIGSTKDKGVRYFSPEKNNYAELAETALFSINDGIPEFKGYSQKRDCDFVKERDFAEVQAPQRESAEQFIVDFLTDGMKETADLDESAKAAGISRNTLSRAKTSLREKQILGVKSLGFGKDKRYFSYLRKEVS